LAVDQFDQPSGSVPCFSKNKWNPGLVLSTEFSTVILASLPLDSRRLVRSLGAETHNAGFQGGFSF
jgi:hypothetical protein